ncbi:MULTISPECIES: ABC transporter substrate-binding protein [Halomicrobium]|uniref:Extracellular solute-binding protein family 5 n=2 Tax=Halomicrobium mukohataei TaxID=57705 RepID=C7P286_HALMD|nr:MULTISPECIES: ABC transporter substrate-binding protein [Halomicrobium]ACV47315.1 extracellular solute-binding protein family 5 [Halomicrobium mukohataei DSM 12286]QCD65785.1 ABC transporter substrate-binding protein [Halomicrobium mukohataei]QFR20590.1 ABC transporter substrate-binding protein [Halomicrobium sp. ZPS1]
MADKSNDYKDVLSRRRFVALTGAAGAAALAGCDGSEGTDDSTPADEGGDDDTSTEDDDMSTEDDSMEVADVRHRSGTSLSPADIQFNPWGQNTAQISNELIFDPFAEFNYATGEYVPAIIEEWEYTGDTFEMVIQEGATWHDGEPVTAQDLATYLRLDRESGSSIWDWGSDVEEIDDRTVAITIEGDINPSLIEFSVMENRLTTKHSRYGDVLSETQNADDNTPLTEFVDDEPIGNGIFQYGEADEQVILTERHADHPNADNVNFKEYAFQYFDGNTAIHQALLSGNIESMFAIYTPGNVVTDLPDSMNEYRTPRNGGVGIIPNHNHDHLGRREVRQAIAYAMNRTQVAANSDPRTKVAPRIPTALPNAQLENWLGDSMEDFETYGRESSEVEKAASVLKEAGYSRNGDDVWEDEDGNTLSFELIAPGGWSDWVTAMESVADQLNAAGMDVEFSTVPFGDLGGSDGRWAQGNFDATAEYWTAAFARAAHPYHNLRHQMVNPKATLRENGYAYPGAVEDRGGSEADITVPALDGSGELTVNPVEDVGTLGSTSDSDTEAELALELLWVSNQDLPMIPIQEGLNQTFISSKRFDIPAEDAEVAQVQYANTWLPRQGEMTYNGN